MQFPITFGGHGSAPITALQYYVIYWINRGRLLYVLSFVPLITCLRRDYISFLVIAHSSENFHSNSAFVYYFCPAFLSYLITVLLTINTYNQISLLCIPWKKQITIFHSTAHFVQKGLTKNINLGFQSKISNNNFVTKST